MSPSKTAPSKPVTPDSVKGLMVIEAILLGFLSFWMASEYSYNSNLQQYANNAIGSHATTFTVIIGLTVGLGGTAVAYRFWRSLQETKDRLERASPPRLKGGVRHALSALPTMDEEPPVDRSIIGPDSAPQSPAEALPTVPATPPMAPTEEKVGQKPNTTTPPPKDQSTR